jgi:toxin YoeB
MSSFCLVCYFLCLSVFWWQAEEVAKKLASSGLESNAKELLRMFGENPYQNPSPYEKLVGDLAGAISRHINIQHRLV